MSFRRCIGQGDFADLKTFMGFPVKLVRSPLTVRDFVTQTEKNGAHGKPLDELGAFESNNASSQPELAEEALEHFELASEGQRKDIASQQATKCVYIPKPAPEGSNQNGPKILTAKRDSSSTGKGRRRLSGMPPLNSRRSQCEAEQAMDDSDDEEASDSHTRTGREDDVGTRQAPLRTYIPKPAPHRCKQHRSKVSKRLTREKAEEIAPRGKRNSSMSHIGAWVGNGKHLARGWTSKEDQLVEILAVSNNDGNQPGIWYKRTDDLNLRRSPISVYVANPVLDDAYRSKGSSAEKASMKPTGTKGEKTDKSDKGQKAQDKKSKESKDSSKPGKGCLGVRGMGYRARKAQRRQRALIERKKLMKSGKMKPKSKFMKKLTKLLCFKKAQEAEGNEKESKGVLGLRGKGYRERKTRRSQSSGVGGSENEGRVDMGKDGAILAAEDSDSDEDHEQELSGKKEKTGRGGSATEVVEVGKKEKHQKDESTKKKNWFGKNKGKDDDKGKETKEEETPRGKEKHSPRVAEEEYESDRDETISSRQKSEDQKKINKDKDKTKDAIIVAVPRRRQNERTRRVSDEEDELGDDEVSIFPQQHQDQKEKGGKSRTKDAIIVVTPRRRKEERTRRLADEDDESDDDEDIISSQQRQDQKKKGGKSRKRDAITVVTPRRRTKERAADEEGEDEVRLNRESSVRDGSKKGKGKGKVTNKSKEAPTRSWNRGRVVPSTSDADEAEEVDENRNTTEKPKTMTKNGGQKWARYENQSDDFEVEMGESDRERSDTFRSRGRKSRKDKPPADQRKVKKRDEKISSPPRKRQKMEVEEISDEEDTDDDDLDVVRSKPNAPKSDRNDKKGHRLDEEKPTREKTKVKKGQRRRKTESRDSMSLSNEESDEADEEEIELADHDLLNISKSSVLSRGSTERKKASSVSRIKGRGPSKKSSQGKRAPSQVGKKGGGDWQTDDEEPVEKRRLSRSRSQRARGSEESVEYSGDRSRQPGRGRRRDGVLSGRPAGKAGSRRRSKSRSTDSNDDEEKPLVNRRGSRTMSKKAVRKGVKKKSRKGARKGEAPSRSWLTSCCCFLCIAFSCCTCCLNSSYSQK